MSWLLNEDIALKYRLQGMTVSDAVARKNHPDGRRKVPVRYRMVQNEDATLTYPIVIIEYLGAFLATERMQMSDAIPLTYAPTEYNDQNGNPVQPWWPDGVTKWDPASSPYRLRAWPLPYNLDYQISVYSRLAAEHHYPLIARMAQLDKVPARHGWVDVPQDGTWRRMHLTSGPDHDYARDKDGKYLFRSAYRVRIESELILDPIDNITPGQYPRVREVDIDLSVYEDVGDITVTSLRESVGIYSNGAQLAWNTQAG